VASHIAPLADKPDGLSASLNLPGALPLGSSAKGKTLCTPRPTYADKEELIICVSEIRLYISA